MELFSSKRVRALEATVERHRIALIELQQIMDHLLQGGLKITEVVQFVPQDHIENKKPH